jgi:hypothetical protein
MASAPFEERLETLLFFSKIFSSFFVRRGQSPPLTPFLVRLFPKKPFFSKKTKNH